MPQQAHEDARHTRHRVTLRLIAELEQMEAESQARPMGPTPKKRQAPGDHGSGCDCTRSIG
jgi:hypothetical protein